MLKKTLLLLAIGACTAATHASAQLLTISEVYGGGGNTGSTYKNDFIELYNYGTTSIDMSALAVYYASTIGSFSNAAASNFTTLSGTLAAGSFYLIQEAAGSAGTTALSNVNVTGSINLSATGGKVALGLASTVPASTAGAVTATNNPSVIDFIGYSSTANQYIGTGPAPAPANTTSDSKASPPSASVSNSSDFTVGTPSPMGTGAVPEPSTYACMPLGGLGAMAMLRYRRRA